MKTRTLFLLVAAAMAAFVAGCSTPETRIKAKPELFAKLTPTQQELIKKGEVGLGFDQEMVKLALGEPDRIFLRTEAGGSSEAWSYVTYEGDDGMLLYRGYYHRYYNWSDAIYPYYLSYPHRRERERFRVVFRDGKVVSIEQEKR